MHKPISIVLAAATLVSVLSPLASTPAEARRGRGAAIAAGVIIGAATAAALASSSRRAHASEVYVEDSDYRWRQRCARLARRCHYGNDYACDQYEDQCEGY